ncbi:uncharacterized protein LOC117823228 isoform X2 [Notolabrus celidotus]|uniref:uncharacterized protein LOC117823228 isoform X2 n=1 Tax=Notolabrus celidotus TaxID=1203425 RepID=UPI00149083DF|nr:uncharacterized protein LOC117823228 isoform X2 [Notolabrus celidotus]
MSVTVENGKGVTVITVLGDKNSMLPPVCQILKALCYSPTFCSVKSGMMQTGVTAALGTIQIMVGLFSIGLGPGRTSMHPEDFAHLGVAYWLGGVFLVSGLISILAGHFSSVCSVISAVIMNILGAIFSIVGIVLYGIELGEFNFYGWYSMEYFFRRLMTALDVTMLLLTVLQLCVCISFAVLGIKALKKKTEEDIRDVELYKPELKEALLTGPDP